MRKIIIFIIFFLASFHIGCDFVFGESIQERFKGKDSIVYKIFFNGIPSGYINWKYLGKQYLDGKEVEALSVSSDTKILKFLNLTSNEKVFIDSKNHLPVRVERDIVLFGRKEFIEEIYNQEEGTVTIIRRNSHVKERVLKQTSPIHNILALLYFFPKDIGLEKSRWMNFNLPNQKIRIKMVRQRILSTAAGKKETYFLVGRGAKRFNLWLDKESRLPLRLEFIFLVGKISIVKQN